MYLSSLHSLILNFACGDVSITFQVVVFEMTSFQLLMIFQGTRGQGKEDVVTAAIF
jgi:hypothetical protein